MSYEFYKLLHIGSILILLATFIINLYAPEDHKWSKICSGIFSLLILVAGMGLLARLEVPHGEPFPVWVIVKMLAWLSLAILVPVGTKRLKHKKEMLLGVVLLLMFVAAYFAIFKPFT